MHHLIEILTRQAGVQPKLPDMEKVVLYANAWPAHTLRDMQQRQAAKFLLRLRVIHPFAKFATSGPTSAVVARQHTLPFAAMCHG